MKFLIVSILLLTLFAGCHPNPDNVDPPATCDVKGVYAGTAIAAEGNSTFEAYDLRENNFAVGSLTVGGPAVTWGGYRGTCDSIIISSYYGGGNGDYYILKGALNSAHTVLSGTYQDLSNAIHGTFSFTKQ
jgi:hypothetical protein